MNIEIRQATIEDAAIIVYYEEENNLTMSSSNPIHIRPLTPDAPIPFDLLQLADPSRALIETYLSQGRVYVAKQAAIVVGVYVLVPLSKTSIEIKNIAVDPAYQNQGIGKQLLADATLQAQRQGYSEILIGTGNSSVQQLALYQRQGFTMKKVKWNFFTEQYQTPIMENGILCQHLILLAKNIAPE